MATWPVEIARRMSGCLMSEPAECTVMSTAPPVFFFTSSTKALTLRVWNSPSAYGVGMSHLVWACAAAVKASATLTNRTFLSMGVSSGRGILFDLSQHRIGEGKRRGEAGRLDAEEMHQARDAVLARALDLEVGRRLAGARGLRPDAGIARQQRALRQARPVAADRRIEALCAARVHGVIDALHPFDVRTEARLAAEVERHVHPEPARLGNGIDQARERILPRQRVVVSFRVELPRRFFPF